MILLLLLHHSIIEGRKIQQHEKNCTLSWRASELRRKNQMCLRYLSPAMASLKPSNCMPDLYTRAILMHTQDKEQRYFPSASSKGR